MKRELSVVGEKIRTLSLEAPRGISGVAKKMKAHRATLSRLFDNPEGASPAVMSGVAEALGVNKEWLFDPSKPYRKGDSLPPEAKAGMPDQDVSADVWAEIERLKAILLMQAADIATLRAQATSSEISRALAEIKEALEKFRQ